MKSIYALFLVLLLPCSLVYPTLTTLFGTNDHEIKTAIKNLIATGKTVKIAFNDFFHENEQAILQKIKTKYGISDYKWKKTFQHAHNLVHADPLYTQTDIINHQPDDHPFIKEARELIALYGMNPQCVHVHNVQNTTLAQVVTHIVDDSYLTHSLDLNISGLAKLDNDERILTLKHEIRHLWYADSVYTILIDYLMNYNFSDPLYIAFSKNQELRADIMAATDSVEDAHALYKWLASFIPDDTDDFIHPTQNERLEAAKQLYTYLTLEQEYLSV